LNCTLVQVAFERNGIAAADSTVPDNAASSMSLDEEACAAALPQAITLAWLSAWRTIFTRHYEFFIFRRRFFHTGYAKFKLHNVIPTSYRCHIEPTGTGSLFAKTDRKEAIRSLI
jgi:hypothetical protein